jgi:hypothetical protein
MVRPNAPRLITLILAVVLTVVGLTVSNTLEIAFIDSLIRDAGWELTVEHGYWMLLASPVLLILGSLLPNL